MRSRFGRLRAPVAALAVASLVTLGPGIAMAAEEDPLGDVVGTVTDRVEQGQSGGSGGSGGSDATLDAPSQPAPAPTSDDDSPGHETADPTPPDHGQGTIGDARIGEEEVATVGDSKATVEDDDSTTSRATLLALGGDEILGTSADSEGEEETHFGDPLAPLCEGSEGQVCLRILYADAWATDDGSTSSSRSQTGVADVCAGGDNAAPDAECTGPIQAGAANSEAQAERDQASGRTTASSESEVANVCLDDDPVTEECAVGVSVLRSEGSSDSGGAQASASRDSYLLAFDLGGEEQGRAGDPEALALPPACPAAESLLCLFLNQGETYVENKVAGHAQEALHLDVLPGNLDLVLHLARTQSLVHNDGGEATAGKVNRATPVVKTAGPGGGDDEAAGPGVLPNTGGFWSGLLALGLLGVGVGSLLMARSRRQLGGLA